MIFLIKMFTLVLSPDMEYVDKLKDKATLRLVKQSLARTKLNKIPKKAQNTGICPIIANLSL